jgi:hypothetical protein
MTEPSDGPHDVQVIEVPRWVLVPVGLILAAFVLLCLAGSIILIVAPSENSPVAQITFGTGMVLVCLWLLSLCYRMVLGKKVRGGLFGPIALRIIAWVSLLLPVVGLSMALFTHQYDFTPLTLIGAAMYVGLFFSLRSLASHRERNGA